MTRLERLEKIIRDLVKRKNAAPFDSAERTFYERQLAAIRYGPSPGNEAGGIMEQLDPDGWGSYCRPLDAPAAPPEGKVLQLRRGRRSVSPSE